MEAPTHVLEGLHGIRSTFSLRYNPEAILVSAGSFDVNGKARRAQYEPRWELWDIDPQGRDYMVMRLQNPDGTSRPPGDWLVQHIWKIHPGRYDGSVEKMLQALMEEPETLREIGTMKDSDDAIDAASKWAAWTQTPKSGSGLIYRGKRMLSG
jgi:hypothetical protein